MRPDCFLSSPLPHPPAVLDTQWVEHAEAEHEALRANIREVKRARVDHVQTWKPSSDSTNAQLPIEINPYSSDGELLWLFRKRPLVPGDGATAEGPCKQSRPSPTIGDISDATETHHAPNSASATRV